jgi:tetratricopeptide (TPR) repeat protein
MKKSVILNTLVFILILSNSNFAQSNKTALAFSESLEHEKKLEYNSAIETMVGLKDSTTYEVNMRLGWLCYKAGYKKRSLAYYSKAINIMPNAIEPRYGFAYPAYQLEDFKDLIEQEKKIIEIDPNNKTVNGNLGSVYYYSKDYKNALPYFQKIVSLYPFDYDNNLLLAWTNLKLGKNIDAEYYFNVVLLYSPKDASANEGISYIKRLTPNNEFVTNAFYKSYELLEKLDYKGAVNAVKPVYDKSSYFINLRLGWLCYLAGMQTEALGYYKIALELNPKAIEPKFGITYPLELLGNKNELKAQYEAIINIDSKNTTAHYKMGVLNYSNKDYQSAFAHFEDIVKLYPCDSDGLLMLAWTNYQLGNTTEARVLFNKVLYFSPNNASALQGLTLKAIDPTKKKTGF